MRLSYKTFCFPSKNSPAFSLECLTEVDQRVYVAGKMCTLAIWSVKKLWMDIFRGLFDKMTRLHITLTFIHCINWWYDTNSNRTDVVAANSFYLQLSINCVSTLFSAALLQKMLKTGQLIVDLRVNLTF